MNLGYWMPRLQKCPSCKLQTVVVLFRNKVVYRRHTGSGEWAQKCDLR